MKKNGNNKNNKKDNRKSFDLKSQFKKVETGIQDGVFVYVEPLSISEFASKLNKPSSEIIKFLFLKAVACNLNTILTEEQMGEICLEFGYDFRKEIQINEDNFFEQIVIKDDEKDLEKRPPIITIMGHVDHGKTTLLDTIRKTNVASNEAGGITQNIGAYQVNWKNNLITFFDTPGHEAFSSMRARGADLTDIVILVVAADDGLKPQTEEAIDHAKYAKVPIIVFINKMDKPNPNVEKVLSQLADKGVMCEEWGGNSIVVKGSALNNQGIDELLEAIILTSEMMDLKANKKRLANGVTIEAFVDKGLGPVANILVQSGTLQVGDYILVGECWGKIRKMLDSHNRELKEAGPSVPVKISGLNGAPNAGDKWIVTKDEKLIKDLASKISANTTKRKLAALNQLTSLKKDESGEIKELNVILKADVQGSVEALKATLSDIDVEGAKINIIRSSVGAISESDVNLAKTAKAKLFSFNMKPNSQVIEFANSMDVEIKVFNIIYEVKNEVEKMLKGTLDPVYEEVEVGQVEIKQLWTHSSIGTIAGCRVTSGEIIRNGLVRLIRNKEVIIENKKISSLKHGKESISSASAGKECGFTVDDFNSFEVGDIVTIYKMVEKTHE